MTGTHITWRLGLDLGTNSLGWAAIRLEETPESTPTARRYRPAGILAMGSRIFSGSATGAGRDPKSGASLAVDRRDARAMRRRRDRYRQRQRALIKYLIADGLFPTDAEERKALAALDPFALRARGLDEALTPGELARAVFHLNQRRGFKSNRKADRKADEEAGKVSIGIDRLRDAIAEQGARSFGEFLHLRRASATDQNSIPSVRTRLRPETGEGAKGDGYDFYPGRALVEEEFDALWEAQAPHHPALLTPEVHDRLYEIIFDQRPLRQPRIGTCTLVPGETRLAKAHPLFQRRRLLEEVNALMIVLPGATAERLTPEQRDTLILYLRDRKKVSFLRLRKLLKLDPAARFNKESEHRTDLIGDEVRAEMGTKTRFGTRWAHLSTEEQAEIVQRLQDIETDDDETAFRASLAERYDLTPAQARAVMGAHLPQGFGRFGLTATTGLIAALTEARTPAGRLPKAPPIAAGRVIVYSEAVQVADLGHHSDMRTGEVFTGKDGQPELPYYGVALERYIMPGTADPNDPEEMRVGRLTNPTVHIGLNQLRRTVNRLIATYGPPTEIALELARDLKLTEDEKRKRNQENTKNRLAAEGRSAKLQQLSQQDGGANRARLKLWEELNPANVLDRRCVYTGQQISMEMLFAPGVVEVDHILPFSTTLDDSNANKIVCMADANRRKRRQSPYEAWGHTDDWPDIAERAARLPKNKRWRFEPDAMQRFDEDGGFLARHLVDTQYLGRLAREYLTALYPGRGEDSSHVWVSPGRLTEMVRRKLGLNDLLPDHNFGGGADQPKNRLDHRHHAIDAVVIAIVDRPMLNAMARVSGQEGSEGRERIIVPSPWEGFRDDLRTAVNAVVVAHRPDHGTVTRRGTDGRRPLGRDGKPAPDQTAGRLHNDTAYGFTGETDAKGNAIVVHRVPLPALKKAADIDDVRDPLLRAALHEHTAGFEGKAFERMIAEFPKTGPHEYRDIRRVRVTQPLSVIPIRDANGRAYKAYKGDSNYRYDVWEMPDGKWVTQWRGADGRMLSGIVSMFDAHQRGERPRPHPAARCVLSLQQSDIVAIEDAAGEKRLLRVVKFTQDGRLYLAEPQESGALKTRDADKADPFRYICLGSSSLKARRARQVRIDEIGRVFDPGFPARKTVRRTQPRAVAVE